VSFIASSFSRDLSHLLLTDHNANVIRAGNTSAKADESFGFMLELFPELEHSPDIHFREPSRKGMRRVRGLSNNSIPRPLDKHLRIHTLHGDRVRRNVREVADVSLRMVPYVSLRLGKLDEEQREKYMRTIRTRQIMMDVRKLPDWPSCRLAIMRDYLSVRGERSLLGNSFGSLLSRNHESLTSISYPGEDFLVLEADEEEALGEASDGSAKENNSSSNSGKPGSRLWKKLNDSIQSVRSKTSAPGRGERYVN